MPTKHDSKTWGDALGMGDVPHYQTGMGCMDFQPAVRVKGGGEGSVLSRVMRLHSVCRRPHSGCPGQSANPASALPLGQSKQKLASHLTRILELIPGVGAD